MAVEPDGFIGAKCHGAEGAFEGAKRVALGIHGYEQFANSYCSEKRRVSDLAEAMNGTKHLSSCGLLIHEGVAMLDSELR